MSPERCQEWKIQQKKTWSFKLTHTITQSPLQFQGNCDSQDILQHKNEVIPTYTRKHNVHSFQGCPPARLVTASPRRSISTHAATSCIVQPLACRSLSSYAYCLRCQLCGVCTFPYKCPFFTRLGMCIQCVAWMEQESVHPHGGCLVRDCDFFFL